MSVKQLIKAMPKSVRVGPYDFALRSMSDMQARGIDAFGTFSQAEGCITICDALTSEQLAVDTMLHEISHAIYWAYHIRDTDGEERTVSIMGTAWMQVFRDNPAILEWIAKGLGHGL